MPRTARIVALGFPHHITQRGNNKQTIFLDDTDYAHYLKILEKAKNKYMLEIYSYSLMPTHIHLKAIPNHPDSLAMVFNSCQMQFCQYFNKKYKKIGHLWQSRFFSCSLDKKHAYSVSKYIENNPVRSNLVNSPEDWKWSSARDHLEIEKGLLSLSPIENVLQISNWEKYLKEDLATEEIFAIKKHLLNGYPLGNSKFLSKVEDLIGYSLKKKPVGRPRKN